MKTAKKKSAIKRRPPPPKPVDTTELCKELVAMAAFIPSQRLQDKIYKAVRQLQLLDKLVADAGLLRS
jgi:hypothetical protein